MNEIRTGKTQLKASILSLIVGLLAINTKAQTKASTPKQCVEQYVAWKSDPTEIDPEDFFHHKMELHWMEGEKWYKEDGRDYIQKIQAGKYLDRQQEMISIHTEKRLALVSLREIFPSEALITRETLKLEKRKGYWQITEIFISYQSIEEFTSKTSLKQKVQFTQNSKQPMKTPIIILLALAPWLDCSSPSEISLQLQSDYEELASFTSKVNHCGIDAMTFEKRFWQGLAHATNYFTEDVLQNPNANRELTSPFHLRFPMIHEVKRKSLSITQLADGIAALERFTGPWYGLWEEMKVKHLWLPVRQSEHPLPGDFQLLAFQSAFTGDGIGWNFLVQHKGEVHMLGHVYHYDSAGRLTSQTPHYAYLDKAGQITWITQDHIFFETVCHEDHDHTFTGKHYVITGESHDQTTNEPQLTNRFQAIYLAKDHLLPKFQHFPHRTGQAKLAFKILSVLKGLLAATVR